MSSVGIIASKRGGGGGAFQILPNFSMMVVSNGWSENPYGGVEPSTGFSMSNNLGTPVGGRDF